MQMRNGSYETDLKLENISDNDTNCGKARNPLSRGVEKPEGPSALQPTTKINLWPTDQNTAYAYSKGYTNYF